MPRPRKPTRLKVLQGNPGHVAKSQLDLDREPQFSQPKGGALRPPSCLSKQAKTEWKRVIKELTKIGLYQSVDRAILSAYCESWATFQTCQTFLNEYGLTYQVTNRSGTFFNPRPEVGIRDRSLEQLRKFANEFGFTPASRSRIELPKIEKEDALWEALRKPRKIKRPSKLPQRSL